MREMQYNKYKSVKNQMDNGIRKELNEYNNKILEIENKIEFKPKKMMDFNANKNGMNINNSLEDEIKKREEKIKKLDENLNEKFNKSKIRLREFKNKFSDISNDYKIKYHLNLGDLINI